MRHHGMKQHKERAKVRKVKIRNRYIVLRFFILHIGQDLYNVGLKNLCVSNNIAIIQNSVN